jgi:hypothetical protein
MKTQVSGNDMTQAYRFEERFKRTATEYLTAVHLAEGDIGAGDWRKLSRAAEIADSWAQRAQWNRSWSFTALAERIREHPLLFRPDTYGRIAHNRAGDVYDSIQGLARVLGRHLEARAEAKADAKALLNRLEHALDAAREALDWLRIADGNSDNSDNERLLDNALSCYQTARRTAAGGPVLPQQIGGEV